MSEVELKRAEEVEAIRKDIHKQFPEFTFPEPILEPIYFGRLNKTIVQDRKLVLDANTGVQYDVVSDRYNLIPHELIVDSLLKACPKEFGKPEVKLKGWSLGAGFRAEATFPEAKMDKEITVGDMVTPRAVSYSSYNRSTHYGVEVGGEQLICSNGLVIFKKDSVSKRRHIITAQKPELLESVITEFLEGWSERTGLWREWASKQLSLAEMEEITVALPFSEKEREKMMELPLLSHDGKFLKELGKTATLWDLNSAATQMAAHEIKSEKRSLELESQIAQVIESVKV